MGEQYVRRKDGTRFNLKNLRPTVKHGGISIMLWGCFTYSGVGELYLIDIIMDKFVYTRILNTALKKSINDLRLDNFIFQQDNDPKHTSDHVKKYLTNNKIVTLDWPSQSPDLNPIENLWCFLKRNVAKRNPKNKRNLVEICRE
ncbi:Transposable element Tc1 transposase [Dictyocoela muelleri]|nr:Transposable element Tc1 transposase [Dictyocoela muelleri]